MVSATQAVRLTLLTSLINLVGLPEARSQVDEPATSAPAATNQEPGPAPTLPGLLPIPNYTGDIWSRAFLTGDWGGTRTDWANKGVQFQVDWNQYVQGVVDGGRDETTQYGGNLDYVLNLDLMRMGVLDGALLNVRAESRYGNSVNSQAGPILPVNTDAFFPITSPIDDDIPITVTNLAYTQFLSEHLAVMLGKFDTLNGDPNEFASGRGTSQFMNSNFIFNSVLGLRMPYSTLGGAVVWMPSQHVTITSTIMNTLDSSTTTGFGDFGDGGTWTTEADFQYRLGHLPGGQNIGVLYSFDQDFAQINGDLIFPPGGGLVIPTKSSTWAVYWSAWQYLFTDRPGEGPLNLLNGQPDYSGIGVYARFGFADQSTNPVEWSASGGIGGRCPFPGRINDTYGVGYYYSAIQTTLISGVLGIDNQTQGFEAFYNIGITPAAHLTVDVQIVESASSNLDTAIVLGARLGLTF